MYMHVPYRSHPVPCSVLIVLCQFYCFSKPRAGNDFVPPSVLADFYIFLKPLQLYPIFILFLGHCSCFCLPSIIACCVSVSCCFYVAGMVCITVIVEDTLCTLRLKYFRVLIVGHVE